MTVFALLSFLVPLGIAFLPPFAPLLRGGMTGLAYLCGWAVVVAVLFIAGILDVPLHFAAWLTVAAAVAGIAVRLVSGPRPPGWLLHPLPVLFGLSVMLILTSGPVIYEIYAWDSWTNWAGWARQMVATDALYRPEMSLPTVGYTPGWPLAMAFTGFLSGAFAAADAWSAAIAIHLGLLAMLFDLIRAILRKLGRFDDRTADLFAWCILLAALAAELTWTLLPKLLLVEEPQFYFLAAGILALGFGFVSGLIGPALAAATLMMTTAYLFKTSFVAYAPAFLLGAAYLICTADGRFSIGRQEIARLSAVIAALVVPIAFWQLSAPPALCHADTGGMVARLLTGAPVHGVPLDRFAADVLKRMAGFAAGWKLPLTLASLFGIALFVHRRIGVVVLVVLTVMWGAFYVGLVGGMAACFSADEIDALASVQRYSRVPLRLTQTVGIIFLVAAAAAFVAARASAHGATNRTTFGAAIALIAVLAAYQAHVGGDVIRHVAERENIDSDFRNRVQSAKRDVALLAAARPSGDGPLRIMYLTVPPWVEWVAANYHGLGARRGDPARRIVAQAVQITPSRDETTLPLQSLKGLDALVLTGPPGPAVRALPEIAAAIADCPEGDAGRLLIRPAPGAAFACRPRFAQ